MYHKNIDLILPCYNPCNIWASVIISNIDQLSKSLPNVKITIILINDGSTKNIPNNQLSFPTNPLISFSTISYSENKGKGYALRKGVEQSTSDYCIYIDIDFPYTNESIINIYHALENNIDIAVGSRGENYYNGVPPVRVFISKLLRTFNKLFLNMKIYDTQCGLKGFNKKGKAIFLSTSIDRYLFDLEFVYLGSNNKQITIKPVDVTLKEGIVFSKMNLNILKQEGWSFLKLVLRHYKKKLL